MSDTSLFQDLESKKQVITKTGIRQDLMAETKFHLGWYLFSGIIFTLFSILLIAAIVRNFYLPALLIAVGFFCMAGYLFYICFQSVKEYSALNNGAFCVTTDILMSKKSVDHSVRQRGHYYFHVEDTFEFESGLRFVRNRGTPAQKDLTRDACVGDTYYLVILDYKPNKPRYIYNTKSFEYKER